MTCHAGTFQSDNSMPVKIVNVEGVGPVNIIRKRGLRSIRLNVDNQGAIRLTLPWWVSAGTGIDFVQSKKEWLSSQMSSRRFIPRNHMIFGKGLHLNIEFVKSARSGKRLDESVLTVRLSETTEITDETSQKFITKAMAWALRVQSEELLLPRLRQLADQHNFAYKSCSVKQLKARWGSCNHSHDIVLNLYLIQMPWEIIDYVLLHELNHTKHLYHGPVFWQGLEAVCPDYKELRKKLRPYQPRLYDTQ